VIVVTILRALARPTTIRVFAEENNPAHVLLVLRRAARVRLFCGKTFEKGEMRNEST
jgi:hypothetical protein